MLEAKIVNLAVTDKGFALILKPEDGEKVVPIFIGALEAQSITMVLLGLTQPRPLTHDLFTNVLSKFNIALERIIIDDLRNDTFYAKMVFEQGGDILRLDSRPSDAIAMALRSKAPVFVEEKVVEEAGIFLDEQDGKISFKDSFPIGEKDEPETSESSTENEEEKTEKPKNRKEELLLLLDNAVKEERYEDAAKLRDELEKYS